MSSSFYFIYEDPDRNTPLHIALKKGNWVIISLLMEHIKPGTKFNIRNAKDEFPYQCSDNPAIRDLFYRTYVVNAQSIPQQDSVGIGSVSDKMKSVCEQYRKLMLDKLKQAQKQCENEKKQVMQSQSFKIRKCQCKKCQGCQFQDCQRIAKYACFNCLKIIYCEKCIEFCQCENEECKKKAKNFIKIQQIPFDYTYPDFKNFVHAKNNDEKQDNEQQ